MESFTTGKNVFLTVENTMMDCVSVVNQVKTDYNATDKAVIVLGDYFGGNYAAWMRMKFPQHFQGALASSAPMLYWKDSPSVDDSELSMSITNIWANIDSDQRCMKGMREAFYDLNTTINNEYLYDEVSAIFNTCSKLASSLDVTNIMTHIE